MQNVNNIVPKKNKERNEEKKCKTTAVKNHLKVV